MEKQTVILIPGICAALLLLALVPATAIAADVGKADDNLRLPPLIFKTDYCDYGDCGWLDLGVGAFTITSLIILAFFILMKTRKGRKISPGGFAVFSL